MKTPHTRLLSSAAAAIVAAACFAPQIAPADDPATLKFTWQVGKTYAYRMDSEMDMEMAALGAGNQKVKMSQEISMTVRKADEGDGKVITGVLERMAMEMNMAGQAIKFDSSKPPAEDDIFGGLIAAQFEGVINKPFEMLYDKDDKFVKVLNAPKLPEGGGLPAMEVMSPEQVQQMFSTLMDLGAPEKPVEVGGKWSSKSDIAMPGAGKTEVNADYLMEGREEKGGANCAKIISAGTIKGNFAAGDGEGAAPQIKISDSTMEGMTWWDEKIGAPRASETTMDLKMDVSGQVMKAKQKMTASLLKFEDAD
ncbi:MAG: hypothetical protein R3F11_11550 [Verrucomicrobiales bacterium]